MIKTYISGGINWNWYLQGEFDDDAKLVHIYFISRWHKYDNPRHPKHDNLGYEVMEDKDRNLYGIKVNGVEYLVTNPSWVFGYNDMSHLILE